MPLPATIRPYDRPDAAQIIQSLAARAMGHRASMSGALTSGNLANLIREDGGARNGGHVSVQPGSNSGLNGFKMPLNPSFSFGGSTGQPGQPGGRAGHHAQRMSFSGGPSSHQRTGSASQSWNRGALNGALGFGNNNPPSLGAARLPTHSELSSGNPSRCTSSSGSGNDPIVVIDGSAQLKSTSASLGRTNVPKARRESVSADKALREVEKALQSVEAQS